LRKRRYRSMLLIDLAVPRNIDPKIDNIDGAFLFNVDDLSQVMEEGKLARQEASQAAEQLVSEEVKRFFQSLARAELGPRIGEITRSMEAVRLAELERSRKLLQSLSPEQEKALHQLTKALVKKVMHRPLQGIHTAARDGDHDRLESLIALWQEEK
jgi:glutamyl-tRNA reductase